jgi:uncharacterized iron-regulated membrane protein
MRKWHRWLVIFAGLLLVWVAATGLIGQVVSLAGGEHHKGPPAGAAAGMAKPPAPAGGADHVAPGAKKSGSQDFYHLVIDLHSGNYFGPAGKVVSALLGAAMLFFALSGIWMYIDMFRKRKRIGRSGIFWK